MTLTTYPELEQGSDEWLQARCGLMTCSELNLILTPTLKTADNENTRKHVFELAAQRLTGYTEPSYIGDNMLRGWADEIKARDLYSERIAPVQEIGGMVRDFGTFKLWASPDGLIGENKGFETKSRLQKYQVQTIVENTVPKEHILQVQGNLLVSGRDSWAYTSFCGGMPMWTIDVLPDPVVQDAIRAACEAFELKVQEVMRVYQERIAGLGGGVIMTEREIEQEVYLG
jgi:predicted phage-related endonuclease